MKNKQRVRKHPQNSKKRSAAKISFLISWQFSFLSFFFHRGEMLRGLCWSACPSVLLSARLSACLFACLSACLSALLSICLPACLSICLPACLSISLSICLPVCLSISPSICLPVCLSICPCICLSVCLSVCLAGAEGIVCPHVSFRGETERVCVVT